MTKHNNEKKTSFGSMEDYELDLYLMNALLLLGWAADIRFTTEDAFTLFEICEETYSIQRDGKLTPKAIDELSLKAYNILVFQIMNVQERADCISNWYINSINMRPLLPLIDEAMMSYFRGYNLASLSIMFIVLERYLRAVLKWTPEQGDVTFNQLKDSVLVLPNKKYANIAHKIITTIYARFSGLNPTQFYFNRHGLLHGLRGSTEYDRMNCARIFLLFDQLCRAENICRTAYGDCLEMFKIRYSIYSQCGESKQELKLLSSSY